jgi:hypothetical protein
MLSPTLKGFNLVSIQKIKVDTPKSKSSFSPIVTRFLLCKSYSFGQWLVFWQLNVCPGFLNAAYTHTVVHSIVFGDQGDGGEFQKTPYIEGVPQRHAPPFNKPI